MKDNNKIVKLHKNSVDDVIEDISGRNFDEIHVLGITMMPNGDREIHWQHSTTESLIKTIGILEYLKLKMLEA